MYGTKGDAMTPGQAAPSQPRSEKSTYKPEYRERYRAKYPERVRESAREQRRRRKADPVRYAAYLERNRRGRADRKRETSRQLAEIEKAIADFRKGIGSKDHERLSWLISAIENHDSDQCLIWPFIATAKNPYGHICYQGCCFRVHRLAFYIANGHWPTPQARHTCDNPPCFNPRHLLEGTVKDNAIDMMQRGRGHWQKQECVE